MAGAADASRRRQGHDYAHNQERWRPFQERGWTAKVQLEAMDTEGIDVAVIYPSRGLFALTIPAMEPRFAAAMARAYNTWLYDFCQENPNRLLGAGMISPFAVQDAVAETRRPTLVFETNHPVRYYIPQQDVRMNLLVQSATQSRCPYKGPASYWSARIGDQLFEDMVWSYMDPIPECPKDL